MSILLTEILVTRARQLQIIQQFANNKIIRNQEAQRVNANTFIQIGASSMLRTSIDLTGDQLRLYFHTLEALLKPHPEDEAGNPLSDFFQSPLIEAAGIAIGGGTGESLRNLAEVDLFSSLDEAPIVTLVNIFLKAAIERRGETVVIKPERDRLGVYLELISKPS